MDSVCNCQLFKGTLIIGNPGRPLLANYKDPIRAGNGHVSLWEGELQPERPTFEHIYPMSFASFRGASTPLRETTVVITRLRNVYYAMQAQGSHAIWP